MNLYLKSCWFSSCRRNLTSKQWDIIRKNVYEKANYCCEICGEQGTRHRVECHDVWSYDENGLVQKLEYFQALCPLCHEVKHLGLASVLDNYERAISRFKKINNLEDKTSSKIINAVFREWGNRSKVKWLLDIELLREYGINPNEVYSKVQLNKESKFKLRTKKMAKDVIKK